MGAYCAVFLEGYITLPVVSKRTCYSRICYSTRTRYSIALLLSSSDEIILGVVRNCKHFLAERNVFVCGWVGKPLFRWGGGYSNFSHTCMNFLFTNLLTGIFLSTLDHGFIMSRRTFRSALCFIGYTTIFLWILEIFLFLKSLSRDEYRMLPAPLHYNSSTTGKEMTYPFRY